MPLSAGLAHGRPPHPRRAGWGRGARLTPPSSWSPPGAPQGLSPSSRVSLENRGRPLEPGTQWGFGPPSCGRARASGRSARTHGERGWGRLSEPLSVPGPRHRPEQQLPWSPGGRQAGTGQVQVRGGERVGRVPGPRRQPFGEADGGGAGAEECGRAPPLSQEGQGQLAAGGPSGAAGTRPLRFPRLPCQLCAAGASP